MLLSVASTEIGLGVIASLPRMRRFFAMILGMLQEFFFFPNDALQLILLFWLRVHNLLLYCGTQKY